MACKRSGVRIPIAPLNDISAGQRHIRGLYNGLGPPSRHLKMSGSGMLPNGVSAVQRLFSRPEPGSCAGSKRSRSCECLLTGQGASATAGYQAGYRQAGVGRYRPRNAREQQARPRARDSLSRGSARAPGREAGAAAAVPGTDGLHCSRRLALGAGCCTLPPRPMRGKITLRVFLRGSAHPGNPQDPRQTEGPSPVAGCPPCQYAPERTCSTARDWLHREVEPGIKPRLIIVRHRASFGRGE
jgi:hypothetical protein